MANASAFEYSPTPACIFLILFGVFPLIYICGRVTLFAIYCLFKVIRAMCQVLLNGGVLEETSRTEKEQLWEEEKLRKAEERRQRKALKSRQTRINKQLEKQDEKLGGMNGLRAKTPLSSDESHQRNGVKAHIMTNTKTKLIEKSSDISDSLNSEAEDFVSQHA